MATKAMTALANITVASATSTITFSSISGAYRDLRWVISFKPTTNTDSLQFRINSDSGSNYNRVFMEGYAGDGKYSAAANNQNIMATLYTTGSPSGHPATIIMDWLDYTATDKHKPMLIRTNAGTNEVVMTAGRWASSSAITGATFTCAIGGGTFAAGTTINLYGVLA